SAVKEFLTTAFCDELDTDGAEGPNCTGGGAGAVVLPVGVLKLDTHSSSEADPLKSLLPLIFVTPMVSPFLCPDDSEALTARKSIRPLPSQRLALRHTPPVTTIADSSVPSRFVYPPLARTLQYSEAYRFPSCVDPLPPRKRFRDSILPKDSVEEDIDAEVLVNIKVNAMVVEVAVDIDVEARVDAGIGMEVDVRVDVEKEVEGEVESSDR
nr:hypothetical protein [Tanacetum cinerariifolium]